MKDTRIIFMGTPEFAAVVLQRLIDEKYNVVAVVSQPDRPVGRKQSIVFSPVKACAITHQIPVIQPLKIKTETSDILKLEPELIITCAYGQLIPEEILKAPKYGCINIHASLLPKLRGGAPIHKAIIYGETETGISIMKMAKKMDAGDVAYQESIKIEEYDTMGTLHDRLAQLAASMIVKVIPEIVSGKAVFKPQDEAFVTFAYNVSKEEEFVSFKRPYQVVYNHIRGLIPWPVGHGKIENQVLKLHQVRTSTIQTMAKDGTILPMMEDAIAVAVGGRILLLDTVQFAGKGRINAHDFYNGKGKGLLGKQFE